jgi:hypothetical protein
VLLLTGYWGASPVHVVLPPLSLHACCLQHSARLAAVMLPAGVPKVDQQVYTLIQDLLPHLAQDHDLMCQSCHLVSWVGRIDVWVLPPPLLWPRLPYHHSTGHAEHLCWHANQAIRNSLYTLIGYRTVLYCTLSFTFPVLADTQQQGFLHGDSLTIHTNCCHLFSFLDFRT